MKAEIESLEAERQPDTAKDYPSPGDETDYSDYNQFCLMTAFAEIERRRNIKVTEGSFEENKLFLGRQMIPSSRFNTTTFFVSPSGLTYLNKLPCDNLDPLLKGYTDPSPDNRPFPSTIWLRGDKPWSVVQSTEPASPPRPVSSTPSPPPLQTPEPTTHPLHDAPTPNEEPPSEPTNASPSPPPSNPAAPLPQQPIVPEPESATEPATEPANAPQVIERRLRCTLEELFYGTTKKVRSKRKTSGELGEKMSKDGKTCAIPIARGLKDGDRIKFTGVFENDITELHFVIEQEPHRLFSRRGDDLYYKPQIFSTMVKTIDGVRFQGLFGKKNKFFPGYGMPKSENPEQRGVFYVNMIRK
ncbi:hypothetical protein BU16DRAFT_566071 [Lophium mytilinum]|uniref:Chaperone DnaJ C-terminal domain-containing protein n=1 Tax=Lophium mytilinum TaxID=390894 RepID=A0A6A6QGC2_9PEZI|nr:hypothetical protein BU16DRAFT_566071 [Lophium mytilinum]